MPRPADDGALVASKLRPPRSRVEPVPRARLLTSLDGDAAVVLVVAPAGFGKTVLAQQWAGSSPGRSVAWLSVDLLDGAADLFWRHLLAALGSAVPGLADEPRRLLEERGADDPVVLAALCRQILRCDRPVGLVLDDLDRLTHRPTLHALALLSERTDGHLTMLVSGRSLPGLPVARWRAAARLVDVGRDDLRFTLAEARQLAATRDGGVADEGARLDQMRIEALNRQVEGWPIGLHLALLASRDPAPAGADGGETARSPIVVDYVLAEVLSSLPEPLRGAALSLSILQWCDPGLAMALLGPGGPGAMGRLRDAGLLHEIPDQPHGLRFHELVRSILEDELRRTDPSRLATLHRRAADALAARGDGLRAHRHLLAIGDVDGAVAALAPSMDLVDDGHAPELLARLRELPEDFDVRTARQATDLAVAWFVTGQLRDSSRWADRAEALARDGDPGEAMRIAMVRAMLAIARGDDLAAARLLDLCDRLHERARDDWAFTRRFHAVAARHAVVAGRPDAKERILRVETGGGPAAATEVFLPAIEAVHALQAGDLHDAAQLSRQALECSASLGLVEHPAAIEAHLAAAGCALGEGRLADARELVAVPLGSPIWRIPWIQVRAGALQVEVLRRLHEGPAALELSAEMRAAHVGLEPVGTLGQMSRRAHAGALVACGRLDDALAALDGMPPTPATQVARARALLRAGRHDEALGCLAERDGWIAPLAIEATVQAAIATTGFESDDLIVAALRRGHETGWVAPFLGYGSDLDRVLARAPVEHLHPALAARLAPLTDRAAPDGDLLALTPRELDIVELLPTHLSYAQIARQLHLSVNTVKTNLKSIYRKLQVGSRTEAVELAHRIGVLSESGSPSDRA